MGANANGINVFDRRETMVFQQIDTKDGEPVYRQSQFVIVQYGNDPEEFIEPQSISPFEDCLAFATPQSATSASGGVGRVIGTRFIQGRLSPFHSFNDYDAVAIGCESQYPTPQNWP